MPPPPRKAVPRRPNQPRVVVDRPLHLQPQQHDPTKTHCDICWGKHGKRNMNLHHCVDCGVAVHFECYGYVPSLDNTTEEFQCWPCRAVGTTIQGRNGTTRQITSHTIHQRPTECSLCSVKDNDMDFPHALHPLYDHYGLTGRQVELAATPTQPTRLAWVHTLCANVVCQLVSGVVYGCTLDGSYDGDDEDDTNNTTDDAPPNPLLQDSSALSQILDVSRTVHHYTYVFCPPGQAENDYTRLIRVHQRDLKCCFCRRSDTLEHCLRIPVQCCAGDATEFDEFRTVHQRTTRGAPCTVGMHVGCAVWYRTSNSNSSWPQHRHVYFFPGQVVNNDDPTMKKKTELMQEDVVCDIFCHVHAQELTQAGVGGKTLVYPPPRRKTTTTTTSTLATRRRNGGTSNNNNHATLAYRTKSKKVNPATTERPPTKNLDTNASSLVETANQLAPNTATATSSTATTKTATPPQAVETNQSMDPEATAKKPQIPNSNKALDDSIKTTAASNKLASTEVTKSATEVTKPTSTAANNNVSDKPQQQPAIATASATVTSNTARDRDNNHSDDDDDDDDMNLPVIPRKKRIQERIETHPKKQKTISKQEPVVTVPGSTVVASVKDNGAAPAPCDTATDSNSINNSTSTSSSNDNEKTGSKETEQPPELEKRQRTRKKNIRESKLSSSRDGSKLEKIYNDIVNDLQLQLSSKDRKHDDNLEKLSILLEANKEKWKKQLLDCNASPDALSSMWDKVKQKFERPRETTTKTGDDWSFLLVGKNYDPKRLQFLTWDTCEKLPPGGKSSSK